NFWVDIVRVIWRLLLPVSIIAAVALIVAGVVQNVSSWTDVTTVTGQTQS
ncbi:potassium-transporting ATPase subunit KdpA, partial [Vibrio parahaemolyticus]